MRLLAALLCALALACPALAQSISGTAQIIDGDSLELAGWPQVRLWGIDAPEQRQTCIAPDGKDWPCGRVATVLLGMLIADRPIACGYRDKDRRGRWVMLCRVEGKDLSAAMVEAGMALAFRRYSLDYVAHEDRAREAKRGMWAGPHVAPWDWRKGIGR